MSYNEKNMCLDGSVFTTSGEAFISTFRKVRDLVKKERPYGGKGFARRLKRSKVEKGIQNRNEVSR